MNTQVIVYVLIGQRGAGKSTFAQKLSARQPEIRIISRDTIPMDTFGRIDYDSYSGNLGYAEEAVWCEVGKILVSGCAKVVLDHWSWTTRDRQFIIRKLREFWVTTVVALYFKTPLEFVEQWFWTKPKIAKGSEAERIGYKQGFTFYLDDAPQRDFESFHCHAKTIFSDGFDQVIEVDPTSGAFPIL